MRQCCGWEWRECNIRQIRHVLGWLFWCCCGMIGRCGRGLILSGSQWQHSRAHALFCCFVCVIDKFLKKKWTGRSIDQERVTRKKNVRFFGERRKWRCIAALTENSLIRYKCVEPNRWLEKRYITTLLQVSAPLQMTYLAGHIAPVDCRRWTCGHDAFNGQPAPHSDYFVPRCNHERRTSCKHNTSDASGAHNCEHNWPSLVMFIIISERHSFFTLRPFVPKLQVRSRDLKLLEKKNSRQKIFAS